MTMPYAPRTVVDCSTGTVTQVALTPQEQAARDAEATTQAAVNAAQAVLDGNESTLRSRADAALAANETYLAIASPNNAQVVAQVNRLTKEASAVIRLLLRKLDSTAGTS